VLILYFILNKLAVFYFKAGDNQWILTVKTKVLTHKIEILTRFYIIAFANAIIQ